MKLDFAKYRGIIVSVALFLLLDASVLMLNFYISFEIAEDAVGVNLAGRQRMLSQRMMKSLLDLDSANSEATREKALIELDNTVGVFDTTLGAFDQGGVTPGADSQEQVLQPVSTADGRAAIASANEIWAPFHQQLRALLASAQNGGPLSQPMLAAAIDYGRANNLELLRLMNVLTVDLENYAASKAKRLRLIQTVGITLAVINFFIIMFHFLRQLQESDEKIAAAQSETREILDTVSEGLFLLDQAQRIGSQYSAELNEIFLRSDIAGSDFDELLSNIVSDKDRHTARSFIKLLFDPRKKQKLIGDLNPLRQVEVHIPQADGSFQNKHLSFAFSRVLRDGEIIHVLVTVQDISRQVKLAQDLEAARQQGEEQLEMLSTIVQSDTTLLNLFLENSVRCFEQINDVLKSPAKTRLQYLEKLRQIYALIHNYKGEAAALNLDSFAQQAHEFEDQLSALQELPKLGGNDFLGLTVYLNKLMTQTEAVQAMMAKVAGLVGPGSANTARASRFEFDHLQHLADKIAQRRDKEVEVVCSGFNDYCLSDELKAQLNSIALQLLRNAVSHGIEPCAVRGQSQKPPRGEIHIRLVGRLDQSLELTVEDDGAGLDRDKIVQVALDKGLINETEAESLDGKAVMALIFHPQLSTQDEVDEDAGRGIGMYAVRRIVNDLGGRITVKSRRGVGTTFRIHLPRALASLPRAA
ncbi:ATP-binding protein [Spongiibacter taiwanensis]|uniref:ATP-binding protein n=1 Tax=Spongiibacter taiwanensis TaxID=1748242 RepID=UPI002035A1C6|nr:ATP-binding protein [Spongiibacter taiwanensis]USA44064.1 ATP-binding protein [Spongiibacter taiwanensis]